MSIYHVQGIARLRLKLDYAALHPGQPTALHLDMDLQAFARRLGRDFRSDHTSS